MMNLVWCRYAEVAANLPREKVIDFAMAGDGGSGLLGRVPKHGMASAFAQKLAPVLLQMADEVATFHREELRRGR